MCGVVAEGVLEHGLDVRVIGNSARCGQGTLDQSPQTLSDHGADVGHPDRAPVDTRQDMIQRRRQIGCRVDERSVEVEHDGAGQRTH